MTIVTHPWGLSPKEAFELQDELAAQVILENRLKAVEAIAGVDVSVRGDVAYAAVVVLDYPGLEVRACAVAEKPVYDFSRHVRLKRREFWKDFCF